MIKIHSKNVADTEVLLYLPAKDAETFSIGEALSLGADGLTKCAATTRPMYLCRGEKRTDGTMPVGAVMESTYYEIPYTTKPTAGTRVTLHTDGLQVTNTTTNGVFFVESVDEENGVAIGKFDFVMGAGAGA